jgi:SAM-dependent methyltransferase
MRVLDLGCGDGHLLERLVLGGHPPERLVGVDLSPDELALAAGRPALSGVALHHGHAAALPLSDQSVDAVVSHLVLMLLSPVEAVADEMARVLVPGGRVDAILGGGPRVVDGGDAFEIFLDELMALARSSNRSLPRLGDRRIRTLEGLAQVFTNERGFADLAMTHHYVSRSAPFDAIWRILTPVYERRLVAEEDLAGLRERFRDRCDKLIQSDGTLRCSWAVRHFSARRH